MDDKTIARRLKGFEAVWQRLGAAKSAQAHAQAHAQAAGLPLMPGRRRQGNSRHDPAAPGR